MKATFKHGSEIKEFTRNTETTKPSVDTSKDAPVASDESRPLGKLRADVFSIQHQINEFLTDKMKEAKKAQQQPDKQAVGSNEDE